MLQEINVKFNNFLLSLSDAIDLASPRLALHQIRTAFIAWKIAVSAGLDDSTVDNIYLAALLHDIGALSLEEKINLHIGFEDVDPDVHCILGEALFEMTDLLAPAAKLIRYHHTPWEQWDQQGVSLNAPAVMESQIINLADMIERLVDRKGYILHQRENIMSQVLACTFGGNEIHRDVTDAFVRISEHEDFWLDLVSSRLYSLLLHFGPFRGREISRKDIFSIASVFRHLIDFKSRFTATHSTGVAECAVILSKHFGFSDSEIEQMEIAGYFHDLGKLAIPNSILEKQNPLTKKEFDIIKQHTYFTYTVLSSIGGLGEIAEIAAFHHEKLDGTGYPFHVSADKINTGARIIAVADKFTAMAEDRPYRKGMTREQVETTLKLQVNNKALDAMIVNILLGNFEEIAARVKEKQEASREFFETKFLKVKQLFASGAV